MIDSLNALIAPLVLSVAAIILMLQIAFWRDSTVSWVLCCGSIIVAILLLIFGDNFEAPVTVGLLLVADSYSVFFSILILFATLITSLLAKDYLQSRTGENEEFYLLLLLSALGALILVSSTHLASFLLGLELLGVALYALIAYPERGQLPLEAAIKYLVLSGAASAILLFGFALIYAALGTLSFSELGTQLTLNVGANHMLILLGSAMVLAGISFKLSLVPFHMWTPDVYQGAPSPVSGFLATASKCAIFAALIRLYVDAQIYQYEGMLLALSAIAIASMVIGNLLALKQENLKRLLAYSSIAHLGYLLITLVVYGVLEQPGMAIEASGFYLAAYVVTSLAAFALLSIVSSNIAADHSDFDQPEVDTVEQIKGLFWRQPLLALLLTIALLSLAGIPLTVGFIGKFYLFTVGIKASLWGLLGALVIGSGIGIYYYLRIIFAMTMTSSQETLTSNPISPIALPVVLALILAMLYLGIYPQPFIDYLGGISL